MAQLEKHSAQELDQLVKEADLGGREPGGKIGVGLAILAGAWSLFQLWYASPLPFMVGFGILNDTEARAIHLAFAIFLAFCAFPAFKHSSRSVIPWSDWLLALVGAFCGAYLFLFYNQLAMRPGAPTTMDIVIGVTGVAVMLEATRRAMGFGMLVTTGLFMAFVFLGPHMPEVLQHRGASLSRFISHMWLTTEGVYGVALGVSVQFIFLAGYCRCRQLHVAGLAGHLGPFARRAGQGGGSVFGAERHCVGFVGVQRGVGRHLHHPADETHGLFRREGGGD
jgi:TRAP-type uncharacterized transport system fused permease subunit